HWGGVVSRQSTSAARLRGFLGSASRRADHPYPGLVLSATGDLGSPSVPHLFLPATRRALAGGAAGTAIVAGLARSASAAPSCKPARHRGAPLLSTSQRHLVGRFSY